MLLFTNENHTATLRSGTLYLVAEVCAVYGDWAILVAKVQNFFVNKVFEAKNLQKRVQKV